VKPGFASPRLLLINVASLAVALVVCLLGFTRRPGEASDTWTTDSCAAVVQQWETHAGTVVTCDLATAGCDCTYAQAMALSNDTYAVQGTSLVTGSGDTTEFCVQGANMTQRDAVSNGTYVVTELRRRG
jgi:hypothetical protein